GARRHADRSAGDRGAQLHHPGPSRRPRQRHRGGPPRHRHRRLNGRKETMSTEAHPITVEVVRNAIVAYADEMAEALCKSAYNMMIYEVRDYCCGLIDTEARMISQNRGGLPI